MEVLKLQTQQEKIQRQQILQDLILQYQTQQVQIQSQYLLSSRSTIENQNTQTENEDLNPIVKQVKQETE